MTRPELHALVDIVMDANRKISIYINRDHVSVLDIGLEMQSFDYHTFSDYTKAVQEYIKTLEG